MPREAETVEQAIVPDGKQLFPISSWSANDQPRERPFEGVVALVGM